MLSISCALDCYQRILLVFILHAFCHYGTATTPAAAGRNELAPECSPDYPPVLPGLSHRRPTDVPLRRALYQELVRKLLSLSIS